MKDAAIRDAAIAALNERRGWSLVRLGDGEGRVLMWPGKICPDDLNKHLRYWFGRDDLADSEIGDMKRFLEIAAINADALGFYRGDGRNKYWHYPQKWAESIDLSGKIMTCNSAHRTLWLTGALDDIIGHAERVAFVTCRNVDEAFAERYGKKPAVIRVPEEANTGKRKTDHAATWPEIRQDIIASVLPGDLWLVGAGVLGKIYCDAIRSERGVALDVGSLFDGWAGVKSRSYLDELYRLEATKLTKN